MVNDLNIINQMRNESQMWPIRPDAVNSGSEFLVRSTEREIKLKWFC